MATINYNGQQIEVIVEHKTLTMETAAQIQQCLHNNIDFALMCDRSSIIFIPSRLCSYWIGATKATFAYRTANEMLADISMRLLTHKEFKQLGKKLDGDNTQPLFSD